MTNLLLAAYGIADNDSTVPLSDVGEDPKQGLAQIKSSQKTFLLFGVIDLAFFFR